MDDLIQTRLLFGRVETHPAAPRWEYADDGARMFYRYRVKEYDGDGCITRNEVLETGACLHWPTPEPTLWQRIFSFLR